ncbi:MAG: hypothetical protein NC339_03540 [Muribaculaceae bacterium]|nr:hypothetical protein [Muribaculaceae bacterium]
MKHLIISILVLLLASQLHAQLTVEERIAIAQHKEPREKIYIQTNQPDYAKGDTIWFRCNLVDGATYIPSTSPLYPKDRSKFVYIELHDVQADSLMARYKIKADSAGVFANCIPLSYDIPQGYYMLVAYTRWMMNFSQDDFAYHEFRVIGDGNLPDIDPPLKSEYLKVSVYPEGGTLLTDQLQNIVFTVTDYNSHPKDAQVELVDIQTDSIVATSKTQFKGMGHLLFTPQKGKRYRLEAYSTDDRSGETELDKASEEGAVLQVKSRKGRIYVDILSNKLPIENLELLIYSRGTASTTYPINNPMVIEAKKLDSGLVTLALIDLDKQTILSTRTIYNSF